MNVLQINVRLTEGGAAGVALDLYLRLKPLNEYNSFAYGYSKGIRPNSREQELGAIMLGWRPQVILNYLSYKFFNIDVFFPVGKYKESLINAIDKCDVVHLHVVHSYFIDFNTLIDIIISKNKKVIWTLHDYWIITGRCAITDGCDNWKKGCGNCPSLNNYPAVKVDRSYSNRKEKAKIVRKLHDYGCKFVSPSEHLKNDVLMAYPYLDCVVINNSLDLATEEYLLNRLFVDNDKIHSNSVVKILIIAHDLTYNGKTNYNLINNIIKNVGVDIEIHTVGKNSPFNYPNVINHGYISDKDALYKVICSSDCMLFTSEVDNYPLVIGECLSLGVPVIAMPSAAAREVLSAVGGKVVENEIVLHQILERKSWMVELYDGKSLEQLARLAYAHFSGERLLKEYLDIYEL